jgi:hypothetical protein
MALGSLWMVLVKENRWLHTALGTLIVTDRRLLWRRLFDGKITYAIDLAAIEDAAVVERTGFRGEVHLAIRVHNAKVEEQVLAGVPTPDEFMAALRPGAGADGRIVLDPDFLA